MVQQNSCRWWKRTHFESITVIMILVIHGNSMGGIIIHYCVTSRRLRGKLGTQKMVNLPKDRMIEALPFTYCGLDMFGLFIIK